MRFYNLSLKLICENSYRWCIFFQTVLSNYNE